MFTDYIRVIVKEMFMNRWVRNTQDLVLVRVEEVLKVFDKDMQEAMKREQWDVEKPAKKQKMTAEKEGDYMTMDYCPNECYQTHKHKQKV